MNKSYSLFVTESATEEIAMIREFNEGKRPGLGFESLEDILS